MGGVTKMQDLKITKPTFKKCEAEWFNYRRTLKEIKLLEEAILHPFEERDQNKGVSQSNVPGDPVGSSAIRLTRHKQLNYLREIASAIETVYNELPKDYKRLVQVRYWSNKKLIWDSIAKECNVSRRQAIYWRDEIILATVEVLGWR